MCGWQAAVNYSPDFYCLKKELMNAAHLSFKKIERPPERSHSGRFDSGHLT